MNHSSRIQSINATRRLRNQKENEFVIPEVIKHVMYHSSAMASKLMDEGEYPVNFDYRLDTVIGMKQLKLGVKPYTLRASKIHKIIDQLSDQESGIIAPVADYEISKTGEITLQMFRA